MKKKTNNITYGLFNYKGRHFLRNVRDIPIYFKRLGFLLTHGYSPMAKWETFEWFTDVMREILENYRNNRYGDKPYENEPEEMWKELNDKEFSTMIGLLDLMRHYSHEDPDDLPKDWPERRERAKNEFFKRFAENFYDLWD